MSIDAEPKSHEELFGDPSKDPSGQDPTNGHMEIFHRWRVDNNPPEVGDIHTDILVDFDSTIGGVGYFVKDSHSESGALKVAHGFRKFSGVPGRATPNRGKSFACVGEVVAELDAESFEVDEDQFEVVTETRCSNTPERHMELFEAEPDKNIIPAIDPSSQAQQMVKTRRAMFIPLGWERI